MIFLDPEFVLPHWILNMFLYRKHSHFFILMLVTCSILCHAASPAPDPGPILKAKVLSVTESTVEIVPRSSVPASSLPEGSDSSSMMAKVTTTTTTRIDVNTPSSLKRKMISH